MLDRPGMPGRQILLVGDNFGSGSSREHAPWALDAWGIRAIIRPGSPTSSAATRSRTGCCRSSSTRRRTRSCSSSSATDPDVELTVDLAEQGVLLPAATTVAFDVDPFAKLMLLAGTDEIGYLLAKRAGDRGLGGGASGRVDTRPPAATH